MKLFKLHYYTEETQYTSSEWLTVDELESLIAELQLEEGFMECGIDEQ